MSLQKGIEIARNATLHDSNDRKKEAIYLYELALCFFAKSMTEDCDPGATMRKTLPEKMKQYKRRVHDLRDEVSQKPRKKSHHKHSIKSSSSSSSKHHHSRHKDKEPVEQSHQSKERKPKKDKSESNHSGGGDSGGIDWVALQQKEMEKLKKFDHDGSDEDNDDSNPSERVEAPPQIDWAGMQKVERAKWAQEWAQEASTASSSALFTNLENATKAVDRALKEEDLRQYDKALESYRNALEYFCKALEEERNPSLRETIEKKMKQYMARAELIKSHRQKSKAQIQPQQPAQPPRRSSQAQVTRDPSKASMVPRKRQVSVGGSTVTVSTSGGNFEVTEVAKQFLEKAVEVANEATGLDRMGSTEPAFEKYSEAVSLFAEALKLTTNSAAKSMISQKMVEYNSRKEQIRTKPFNPIPMGLDKKGEKYHAPKLKKGLKGRTWDKF